jgi:hypothetical protein
MRHDPLPMQPTVQRVSRLVLLASMAVLGVITLGCVSWAIAQAFTRPPDYPEGCILFNAARIRAGLPLYVDPIVGAREYGEPPARYFVAYTPLFAVALAAVPAASALSFARLVGLIAWYGSLARCVATARPSCRRAAGLAALFVASIFLFARWSACAKPDAIALLLASWAFARALDQGHADARSGALFALAALVKPSVIGLALGTLAASLVFARERRWRAILVASTVLFAVLAALQVASGGRALSHVGASVGLAFDARRLVEMVASRWPFVLGLVVPAAVAGWQARRSPAGRIAFAGLLASTLVASFGLGKFGSTINYLMEPSLASVVVLSRFPWRVPLGRGARLVVAATVIVSFAWASNATVHSLADEVSSFGESAQALARIRTRCLDRPGAMVLSPDPGIEFTVNGRIHTHGLELWNEVRLGRFPEAMWADDVRSSAVRCFVAWAGEAPPPARPAGLFPESVARALADGFGAPHVDRGYAIYARTPP